MDYTRLDPRIVKWKLLDGGFLVVTARESGRAVIEMMSERGQTFALPSL
jgi:hypothetical protein